MGRLASLARGALLAALLAGPLAHSHQTPPGDVYPIVTREDHGFTVTYRSSLEDRYFAQPYDLDGKPSAEKKVIPRSKVPLEVRTVNRWPRVKGMSADTELAVLRVIFLGYGTNAGIVSDGSSVEWIRMVRGEALLCRLRISTLEQRCTQLGRVLDGPMGMELLDEPLQRGSERAVLWVNEYHQLMFSSWETYSHGPVRTRLVWNEIFPDTSLASAVNGSVALVAVHLPDERGLFRIRTWTVPWPVPPTSAGK
ncbi:hypothetical protein NR798_10225 [Archangium gephyra]|uniref:hypothetical protein n=1 Tax=Archangium gephyra TaxID=48 RepID=UPI0035D452E2